MQMYKKLTKKKSKFLFVLFLYGCFVSFQRTNTGTSFVYLFVQMNFSIFMKLVFALFYTKHIKHNLYFVYANTFVLLVYLYL